MRLIFYPQNEDPNIWRKFQIRMKIQLDDIIILSSKDNLMQELSTDKMNEALYLFMVLFSPLDFTFFQKIAERYRERSDLSIIPLLFTEDKNDIEHLLSIYEKSSHLSLRPPIVLQTKFSEGDEIEHDDCIGILENFAISMFFSCRAILNNLRRPLNSFICFRYENDVAAMIEHFMNKSFDVYLQSSSSSSTFSYTFSPFELQPDEVINECIENAAGKFKKYYDGMLNDYEEFFDDSFDENHHLQERLEDISRDFKKYSATFRTTINHWLDKNKNEIMKNKLEEAFTKQINSIRNFLISGGSFPDIKLKTATQLENTNTIIAKLSRLELPLNSFSDPIGKTDVWLNFQSSLKDFVETMRILKKRKNWIYYLITSLIIFPFLYLFLNYVSTSLIVLPTFYIWLITPIFAIIFTVLFRFFRIHKAQMKAEETLEILRNMYEELIKSSLRNYIIPRLRRIDIILRIQQLQCFQHFLKSISALLKYYEKIFNSISLNSKNIDLKSKILVRVKKKNTTKKIEIPKIDWGYLIFNELNHKISADDISVKIFDRINKERERLKRIIRTEGIKINDTAEVINYYLNSERKMTPIKFNNEITYKKSMNKSTLFVYLPPRLTECVIDNLKGERLNIIKWDLNDRILVLRLIPGIKTGDLIWKD